MKSAEARYAFLFRNITSTLLVFAVTYALNAHFLLEISPVFLAVAALAADVLFAVLDRFKKNAVLWVTLGTAPVSYTHLDVYKRQDTARSEGCREGTDERLKFYTYIVLCHF